MSSYKGGTHGKHVIDCDVNPFCPDGWKVEEHRKAGQMEWDPARVQLWLSKEQAGNKVEGNTLRNELATKPVLNANVLDYLLAHPELIPEEWRGKLTYFWGTIYRSSLDNLVVRCLRWDGDKWNWNYNGLFFDWYGGNPAALLAS